MFQIAGDYCRLFIDLFVIVQRLADGLSQLDELIVTLEQSIKDIIKDCEAKKKVQLQGFILPYQLVSLLLDAS